MNEYSIGDQLEFDGRMYRVRGFSPMGAGPRRIHLQALDGGDWIELDWDSTTLECINNPGGKGEDES